MSTLTLNVSTLESVFNLTSKESSLMFMGSSISVTVGALLLGNYFSARKTRWIGLGSMVMVFGACVACLPTLFAVYPQPARSLTEGGNGIDELEKNQTICGEPARDTVENSSPPDEYAVENHRLYWMLVLGSVIIGLGTVPDKTAGPTFLDEIFPQKKYGVAISFVFLAMCIGNPAALLFGGLFLQYYVTLDPPPGLSVDSKEWVGAWWMGLLFPVIFVFILGLIILLYPRQMPEAKKVLKEKVDEGITTFEENRKEMGRSMKDITHDLIPAFKRSIKNKAFMCMIAGDILSMFRVGQYYYDPKIFMTLYRLDFEEVGRALGFAQIVGCFFGFTASGILMKIKEWKPKELQLIIAVLYLITVPFSFNLLLRCPIGTTAGVDVSYSTLLNSSNLEPPSLISDCNSECHCTTSFYEPVCDGSVTYFSPCHAGCREVNESQGHVISYSDCSCSLSGTVTPGECGQQCPGLLVATMAIDTADIIIRASVTAALIYSYNRVVNELDRTFSQGLKACLVNLLGFIPAPIFFGWLIDNYCTIWRENQDGTTGNCWVYDVENQTISLVCVRAVLILLSAGFRFLAYWWYPVYGRTEDHEKNRLVPEQEIAAQDTDILQESG